MRTRAHLLVLVLVLALAATAAWAQQKPRGATAGKAHGAASIDMQFKQADTDFRAGHKQAAATEIRGAATSLRASAARMTGSDKTAVEKAAKDLDKTAADINKVDEKQMRQAFARADVAMARYHNHMAKAAMSKKDEKTANMHLAAAQMQHEHATVWAGEKAAPARPAAAAGRRPMTPKTMATAAAHNTDAEIDRLDAQIERLGKKLGLK